MYKYVEAALSSIPVFWSSLAAHSNLVPHCLLLATYLGMYLPTVSLSAQLGKTT